MTAITTQARPNRHSHKPNGHANEGTEQCPWCGSPITRSEFKRIRDQIAEQERARAAKAVQEAAKQIEKVKHDTLVEVAKIRQQAQLDQAKIRKQATEAALLTVPTKIAEAVNAEKLRHAAEKLKLTDQLDDMKRRLEQKTAHQLGEPPEVDLFEALETAFPDDRVSRVVKGQKGPDVIVEVVHGGDVVGKIVLDSKNHARWSNKFTSKLRSDQLVEGAEFAILSTNVFPAHARELHIQDNVIVASPQRVVVLVHLLRKIIIDNHVAQLSQEQRDDKAERLYRYICSPGFHDLLDRIVSLTDEIADLDRGETAAHQKVWSKRAALIAGLHRIHGEVSTTVAGIIAGEAA